MLKGAGKSQIWLSIDFHCRVSYIIHFFFPSALSIQPSLPAFHTFSYPLLDPPTFPLPLTVPLTLLLFLPLSLPYSLTPSLSLSSSPSASHPLTRSLLRTVRNWRPRRFGGGLGGRKGVKSRKDIEASMI